MKILIGGLVALYLVGIQATSLFIQYAEDPFGCRQNNEFVFACPWSPGVSEQPGYDEYLWNVTLWPMYLFQQVQENTKST